MKGVLARVKAWFGPRDEAPEGAPAFDMAPEDEVLAHEGKGARVLVAEASARMRGLYADYLTSLGYAFRIVGSGEGLEEVLDAYGPDVLVLDHRPPHVLGFRLAAEVKAKRAEMPVLLCSAWGDIAAYEEFKKSGADRFLIKPVRKEQLDGALRDLLARRPAAKKAEGKADEVSEHAVKEEAKKPKPKARAKGTYVDEAEELHRRFLESQCTKKEFAKEHRLSESGLHFELRIAQLPEEVKKFIRQNPGALKKSFLGPLLTLAKEEHVVALCREVVEQAERGNLYDMTTVKERVAAFKALDGGAPPTVEEEEDGEESREGESPTPGTRQGRTNQRRQDRDGRRAERRSGEQGAEHLHRPCPSDDARVPPQAGEEAPGPRPSVEGPARGRHGRRPSARDGGVPPLQAPGQGTGKERKREKTDAA
ncbi:MAG: response regulator [Chloroflexi bacterium]|nr:response regulator [Chloroflexota bacterium]